MDIEDDYPRSAWEVEPAWEPTPRGTLGVTKNCKHPNMRIIAWTLEGPLGVLVGCANCAKGEMVWANKRLRKLQPGFSPETWAEFLDKEQARADEEGRPFGRQTKVHPLRVAS